VDRKDFRHEPARKWEEVGWVARRAWMTKPEVKERFKRIPDGLSFSEREMDGKKARGEKKAGVWELWHKAKRTMVFVAEGAKEVLEQRDPYMDLTDFFPCPRPAYATCQRRTLIPVPDIIYYKDQLEEINALTNRIAALTEALRVRGFYSAGIPDVADAIESALSSLDDRVVMKAVASISGTVSGESLKDAIVWLPTEMVAAALEKIVALRQQLMQDLYEISGISDIMRGETDANETLGAQQLKSQYGSIRIRRRQEEMVRFCRDITRMKGEIMAENLKVQDLMVMAQVDDLPTQADLMQQAQQIQQQAQGALEQLMQQPDQEQAQQQAQQIEQQAQQALQQLKDQPTQEAVGELLQSQKLRPFVLDIETDSTIQPDENSEKQNRTEFATATGQMIGEIMQAMQMAPQLGPFLAESLRFVASAFRPGRAMDDAIDELAEGLKNYQPPPQAQTGPDPESQKIVAQATAMKAQADAKATEIDGQAKAQAAQLAERKQMMDEQAAQIAAHKLEMDAQKVAAEIEKVKAETIKVVAETDKTQADTEKTHADTGKTLVDAQVAALTPEMERQRMMFEDRKVGVAEQSARDKAELDRGQLQLGSRAADTADRAADTTAKATDGKIETDKAQVKLGGRAADNADKQTQVAAKEKLREMSGPTKKIIKVTKHAPDGRILEVEQSEVEA
jgi:hypothetical protein